MIARGQRWLNELIVGIFTNVEQITATEDSRLSGLVLMDRVHGMDSSVF